MANKWSKTYTNLENVNSGYQYEIGDVVTIELANVSLQNAWYAAETANSAKAVADEAANTANGFQSSINTNAANIVKLQQADQALSKQITTLSEKIDTIQQKNEFEAVSLSTAKEIEPGLYEVYISGRQTYYYFPLIRVLNNLILNGVTTPFKANISYKDSTETYLLEIFSTNSILQDQQTFIRIKLISNRSNYTGTIYIRKVGD